MNLGQLDAEIASAVRSGTMTLPSRYATLIGAERAPRFQFARRVAPRWRRNGPVWRHSQVKYTRIRFLTRIGGEN